jgi:DNA-binding MarR family transcriptional regulator
MIDSSPNLSTSDPNLSTSEMGDRILQAIRRILRQTSEHSRDLARRAGLSVPQALCLRAIESLSSQGREATGAEIGRAIHLAPATVSRLLDRMEGAGLVERRRTARDRRKVVVAITDEGRERLQRAPRLLQERFLERLAAMPPAEQQRLLAALEVVVTMMEASQIDAEPLLDAAPMPGAAPLLGTAEATSGYSVRKPDA